MVVLEESGGKPKGSEPGLQSSWQSPQAGSQTSCAIADCCIQRKGPLEFTAVIPRPAVWLAGYQQA